jgi:hypothetical protein
VHEGLVDVRRCAEGTLTFVRPDGTVLLPVPYPPASLASPEPPTLALEDLHTWDGTPFHLAYSVEVLYTPPEDTIPVTFMS